MDEITDNSSEPQTTIQTGLGNPKQMIWMMKAQIVYSTMGRSTKTYN